jgi:predicted nucleic acid-binding Zn ribbon protein
MLYTFYALHNYLSAMLFNKKHRRKINIVWGVICVLIIISMVLLYMPALYT